MKTPQEYHYVYYSYEEWGMGYFGSRTCKCLPEEDVKYFGSFSDKNFKPTQKIILKSDYNTREEAYTDEIILQEYYKVVENPHFANRAYQTSTKFSVFGSTFTESHRKKISEGQKGKKRSKEVGEKISAILKEKYSKEPSPILGKLKSESHKRKLSESHKGKSLSETTKKKISKYYDDKIHPSANSWRVTFENGKVIELFSLNRWAKESGYSTSALCYVYKNKRKRHKDVIKIEIID